jgi:maltooligosyltrehalose trehalohydrolase
MRPTIIHNDSCTFTVWAPEKDSMILHLPDENRRIGMDKCSDGYFHIKVPGIGAGHRYFYRPDDDVDRPDPVSHYQPNGIHGPSEVIDHSQYTWRDEKWRGLPLEELIFYELHIGAFTDEGTCTAAISRLDDLAATGINAIELMPVAQFPGARNWGYDGTFLYAVQNTYGGPDALKQLVDACHQRGLAVFLDVVYNHVGYEGNSLPFFGPYFTDKYQTPWGKAFNYDGAWSDGVKDFVIGNALHWADNYHIDGLRLDAVHEIFDRNAVRIWDLLHTTLRKWQQQSGRPFYLIAECDLNSPRVVAPPEVGGYGFDSQWMDDFHHALYVLLDKDGIKHYKDFGRLDQFAKAYTEGFVHSGEYVRFRHRRHGASSAGLPGYQSIVFNQNHDLPGNRPQGQRLSVLVDFHHLKLAAAAVLLSPYLPLLFMGEEYGEDTPFYFFSDHQDQRLRDELREGRKKEFATFEWGGEPPDPQNEDIFLQSKLQWNKREKGQYRLLLDWHRQLISLRKTHPLLKDLSRKNLRADLAGRSILAVHRHNADNSRQLVTVFNFSDQQINYRLIYDGANRWVRVLTSHTQLPELIYTGEELTLPAWSAVVYDLDDTSINTLRPSALTAPSGE